ncbi:MAG: Tfp pilus assembly protein PilF [Brasilonema octagenarum HA4186-MV1]|uniref:Tfp pilus assembly protein PilF n=2 Tax=Brasilonema TaxID=383614 RepID=A0A856MRR8_9CYAN|nr:tetratricopeptide repeat protein [Brasilonema sennae]MBW4626990.1 Tfp pilus assembly protein PilF [Brasilonema octagenarum HA4186-MV1]NMF65096.1 Tfp pilus assembly protein PilF [Brasilonema octagenarum UFV-OR1]QDL11846.1 Tfp pilus assembly protein PilF [Brasilonema sennae CENA114]QDL18225.1 Tfp pilus assembly protein PilF [Brasilonema octagenarum UFV-E1]
MSQSRKHWMINVVLVLVLLAFVGVSVVPIFEAFNQTPSSSQKSTSTRSVSPSSDLKSKLENDAQGYAQVLQREPENQTALRGLLETRLQLLSLGGRDIKGVIEPLEKLTQIEPEETKYAVLLAQAKQQIGDKEGAAQAYRSVLQKKPGNLEALQGMVALDLSEKRPEAAITLLQDTLNTANKANQTQPGSVDTVAVQVLLGNVYASQKNYTQASSAYDQAISKDKQDFRPVLAKATLLKEQGKAEDAKTLFTQAAALAPSQYKDEINKRASESSTPVPTPTSTPKQ